MAEDTREIFYCDKLTTISVSGTVAKVLPKERQVLIQKKGAIQTGKPLRVQNLF